MDTQPDVDRSRRGHGDLSTTARARPNPSADGRTPHRIQEHVLGLLTIGAVALALIALIAAGLVAYILLTSGSYLDLVG